MDRPNELRDQVLFHVQKCSELEKVIEDQKTTYEYIRRSRATAMEIIDTLRTTLDGKQRRVEMLVSTIDGDRRRFVEMSDMIKCHEEIIDRLIQTIDTQRLAATSALDHLTARVQNLQQRHEEQIHQLQRFHEEQTNRLIWKYEEKRNFDALAALARDRRRMAMRRMRMVVLRREREPTGHSLRAIARRVRAGNGKFLKAAARRHRNAVALAAEALTEVEAHIEDEAHTDL